MLLDHGAELECVDQWGRTALHVAAYENAEEGLTALLEAGASVHAIDAAGETPLHQAARVDSEQAVRMLLEAKANPNVRNRVGKTSSEVALPNSASQHILAAVTHGSGPKDPSMQAKSGTEQDIHTGRHRSA